MEKRAAELIESLVYEVKRVIVGQDEVLERVLVCLLARGHCLLEGLPGLAKTLLVETLAAAVGGSFSRIQFTPDLVPADIVGTRIYRASTESFDIEIGPVHGNFVLADEINRAPAKVQSALLEVMSEEQVTIAGRTLYMPQPFLVLATQNPIDSEGVYPLPEAQQDRFLMHVQVGYPSQDEEVEIVRRMSVQPPRARKVLDVRRLAALQNAADEVYVDPALVRYIVAIVVATRDPATHDRADVASLISHGASPRASLGITAAARASALIHGRGFALPEDVMRVAPDVLRHRVGLSYEALAQEVPAGEIVQRLLAVVPPPVAAVRSARLREVQSQ